MVTRAEVLAEARSYLGVKWRHQGRSRENGVDCAGLSVLVVDHFNLVDGDLHHMVNYARRPDGTFVNYFRACCTAKPVNDAKDGDLLIFAEVRHPCHVGFRSTRRGVPCVVHAHAGARKVVEQTIESAKAGVGRPVFCFELPGIED